MQMDKKERQYFLSKFSKGKNALARWLDFALGKAAIFAILFTLLWIFRRSLALSLIVSISATAAWSLVEWAVRRSRFERFVERELHSISRQCTLEKLALADKATQKSFGRAMFLKHLDAAYLTDVLGGFLSDDGAAFCYFFPNHPANPVSVQQMQLLYRRTKKLGVSRCICLSAAEYTDLAAEMAARLGIEKLDRDDLLALALRTDFAPTEADIYTALDAKIAVNRRRLKRSLFSRDKQRTYAIIAVLMLCWWAVFRFNVVYPIVALLCAVLAAICHFRPAAQEEGA